MQTRPHATSNRPYVAGVVAVLAWGALAFGGNYPWAYRPLLVAAAVVGTSGLLRPALRAPLPWRLITGLALVAIATVSQLVPLPQSLLERFIRPTHVFLQDYSLVYATEATSGLAHHPISIDPNRTWLGLTFLLSLSLLLVGTFRMLTRETLRAVAIAITGLGVVMALVGMGQKAVSSGKIYGFWEPMFGGAPFGPFVNKNHFAGWMLLALPVTLGLLMAHIGRGLHGVRPGFRNRLLWLSSPDASQLMLLMMSSLTMGLALVLTWSRSGMVAFVLAIIVTAPVVIRRMTGSQRSLTLAYVMGLPLVLSMWVGLDAIAKRFTADTLSGNRWPIWEDSLKMANDFFPVGSGLNTFGSGMLRYQQHVLEGHTNEAHNDYLQLFAEGGLLVGVPVVITLLLFVREIRRSFRGGRREGSAYWLRVGAVMGLMAIAAQSMLDFSLQMPGNAVLFAVVAAMALNRADYSAQPRTS